MYNRATVSSIIQKIALFDMEFYYKNVSKIRNLTYIFRKFRKNFQRKKIF